VAVVLVAHKAVLVQAVLLIPWIQVALLQAVLAVLAVRLERLVQMAVVVALAVALTMLVLQLVVQVVLVLFGFGTKLKER
jgi:hypothetical protein